MIDRDILLGIATEKGVPEVIIEKDYVISWFLYGLSQQKEVTENWVFKGATALHKMYFKDWRFSKIWILQFSTK